MVKAGTAPARDDKVPIRSEARALPNPEPILGYVERDENGRRTKTETPKDYPVRALLDFAPTECGARPYAYLLPAQYAGALVNLQRHGIDVEEMCEDIDLDVETYRIDDLGKPASRGWDRQDMLEFKVTPRRETRRIAAGTFLIKTAQPLGNLAVYLLEPRSEDGLAAWKFFDGLKAGADFPVLRLPQPAQLATTARPTAARRSQARRADYPRHGAWPSRRPPGCSGVIRPHAAGSMIRHGFRCGRAGCTRLKPQPAGQPRSSIRNRWSRRSRGCRASMSEPRSCDCQSAILRHGPRTQGFSLRSQRRSLLRQLRGARAVRLTDHPGHEEHAAFSPDGRSVAFVRDDDLFVVDIAKPAERALTTGGKRDVAARRRRLGLLRGDLQPPLAGVLVESGLEADRSHGIQRCSGGHAYHAQRHLQPAEGGAEQVPTSRRSQPDGATGNRRCRRRHSAMGRPVGVLVGGLPDQPGGMVARQPGRLRVYSGPRSDLARPGEDLGRFALAVPQRLFRDSTKAWIADPDPPVFLKNGTFLWTSERDGWKHLYHYAADGSLMGRVTTGDWEVRSIARVDDQSGLDLLHGHSRYADRGEALPHRS